VKIHSVKHQFFLLFIYSPVHTLFGSFLPPATSQFQAGHVLPLSLVLLKKKDKPNKEGKVFLLIKDSYPEIFLSLLSCTHVMTHVDSSLTDLYPDYWSPSHDNLCCFKVSVLVPPEWGHQMLSCFGFSTYFYITQMCSPLSCDPVQPHCCICCRSKVHIWGTRYDFWSFKLGWPHSEWCSLVPSIYMQMIRFHSSSWLSKILSSKFW
jgi:hypothetical protein